MYDAQIPVDERDLRYWSPAIDTYRKVEAGVQLIWIYQLSSQDWTSLLSRCSKMSQIVFRPLIH